MKSQILAAVLAVPVVAASSFVAINADASQSENMSEVDISTINHQITKLDNGYQMTVTTDNPETLVFLHEKADRQILQESITRDVENIENGVRITITSDNQEAITQILERENNKQKQEKEGVTFTKTELSNGVQIEITSEDSETIEEIQNRSAKGFSKEGRHMKRGGHSSEEIQ